MERGFRPIRVELQTCCCNPLCELAFFQLRSRDIDGALDACPSAFGPVTNHLNAGDLRSSRYASSLAEPAAATHAVRLAEWVLRDETGDGDDPDAVLAAAERICQKLSTRLAKLVTAAGCQSLLARAVHLAAAEAPFVRGVRAGMIPGPCLQNVRDSARGATCQQTQAALIAVVAHLIGLLALFIGDDLTGRLVRDVWPEAPLNAGGTDSAPPEAL